MNIRKLWVVACAGLLMSVAQTASADTFTEIEKSGTVHIAVPQDFQPFGSVNSDMKLQGLDIDVANMIGKALGLKVVLVPVVSANRIAYLQTHKVDLVVSTLGRNAERDKVINFTQPYAPFNNSVYGAADIKVSGPSDLADQTVGVARGTFEDILLTGSAPKSTTIKRYEDNNALIQAYVSGQVRLISTGDFVAITLGDKAPNNRPTYKYTLQESRCVVGLNKDEPTLQAKVNEVLTKAKKSGELNAIVKKWLNVPMPEKMATTFE
jgi:polar amino acid transport system substrate-binding protein